VSSPGVDGGEGSSSSLLPVSHLSDQVVLYVRSASRAAAAAVSSVHTDDGRTSAESRDVALDRWIKMPLGMEVGLRPGHVVLDGDPKRGHSPPFSAHVYCGQTDGWIKMTLGTEVGLGPGHIVLDVTSPSIASLASMAAD